MTNISSIDLNLLPILDALLAERSVSRAALSVGLSQPAMSNALSRLRDLLNDQLLVRTRDGMEPTPRALELAAPLHHILNDVRRTLSPPPSFDPKKSSQAFRIRTSDNLELSLLPHLLERLKQVAPLVDLVMTREGTSTEEDLRTGRIDLFLGTWFSVPTSFKQHLLRQETFACIARQGHPKIKSRLTLKTFVEVGHVLVTPSEKPIGDVDTVLSDQGLGRRVVLRTPHFLIAPLVVARTDLIATLPRGVATTFAEILPLKVYPPPLDAPGFPIQMVWHSRTHEQAPHKWLRRVIMDLSDDGAIW